METVRLTHRSPARRVTTFVLAGMLAASVMAISVGKVAAYSPCTPFVPAPTSDGVWVWGTVSVDCPSPYIADWLKGELVEWAFPGSYWLRDSGIHNGNSGGYMGVYLEYYCNGNGTDDYQLKANVRDTGGGETGWLWGQSRSWIC